MFNAIIPKQHSYFTYKGPRSKHTCAACDDKAIVKLWPLALGLGTVPKLFCEDHGEELLEQGSWTDEQPDGAHL